MDGRARPERDERDDLRRALLPIAAAGVLDDLLAAALAQVNVDVRRLEPLGVHADQLHLIAGELERCHLLFVVIFDVGEDHPGCLPAGHQRVAVGVDGR